MIGDVWVVTRNEEIVGVVHETEHGYIARPVDGVELPEHPFFTQAVEDLKGDDWS